MRNKLLLLFAAMLTAFTASAYDFSAVNDDGVTIYFNITSISELTVEVTSGDSKYSDEVNIPSAVTYVNKEFAVTGIGDWAFSGCGGLTSVTIPNSVTSIGHYAFESCSGLTSVTIPNSVTSIGLGAFRECSGLTSVTIPNSVATIHIYAFHKCSGLTSVTIPNSVTEIGENVFSHCSGLTSVTIPESVTEIGVDTFTGCTCLTAVTIPNSVTTIGDRAFSNCSSLTEVIVGSAVENIGGSAFAECKAIENVYSLNPTPPSCASGAFSGTTCLLATLHVPYGYTANYKSADVWMDFGTVVEDGAPIHVELDKSTLTLSTGDSETLVANLTGGATPESVVLWTSSDSNVATVDADGVVTGVNPGTATITATCGSGSDQCEVTVRERCAMPEISIDGSGRVVSTSETPSARIHTTVTSTDIDSYDLDNAEPLELAGQYLVTSYATADGYGDSQPSQAMLLWAKKSDATSGLDEFKADTERLVLICTMGENIVLKGTASGEPISVYSIEGNLLYSGDATASQFTIPIQFTKGEVYVVIVGERSVKYCL